jgi:hypothetical protein
LICKCRFWIDKNKWILRWNLKWFCIFHKTIRNFVKRRGVLGMWSLRIYERKKYQNSSLKIDENKLKSLTVFLLWRTFDEISVKCFIFLWSWINKIFNFLWRCNKISITKYDQMVFIQQKLLILYAIWFQN